jgi:predicted glycoside hydrolase/deacetylase ChbG (UPF0249 family)
MPADAIIINADDLAMCASVTRGIMEAWRARAISDATVFANSDTLDYVLYAAGEAELPVGVHLNLTYGRPISDAEEVPALVDEQGCFMRRQQWKRPLPTGQVRRELRRQVERVLDSGIRPTHLDSHHHVHIYPEILAEVLALAREFNLPMRALNDEMYTTCQRQNIPCPEHFSMSFYGEQADVDTLIRLVSNCPGGVLEIMTHPGNYTPGMPSTYQQERQNELRALLDPRWRAWLQEHHIRVLGFAALGDDVANFNEMDVVGEDF